MELNLIRRALLLGMTVIQSDNLFTFHLQSNCNQIAARLNQRCATGARSAVFYFVNRTTRLTRRWIRRCTK